MIDTTDIRDAIVSHAQSLGVFDSVNMHEPKAAPGNGLTCGVWLDEITAVNWMSGLNSSSAAISFFIRIYSPAFSQPADDIDLGVANAVDELFARYHGDFQLDGITNVYAVDLLGMMNGRPLQCKYGFIKVDTTVYRTATINLTVLVQNAWDQEA